MAPRLDPGILVILIQQMKLWPNYLTEFIYEVKLRSSMYFRKKLTNHRNEIIVEEFGKLAKSQTITVNNINWRRIVEFWYHAILKINKADISANQV